VRYKLAILNALARRPEGRATLDEVRREVGIIIAERLESSSRAEIRPNS
jgi:hypothetical protein